MVKAAVFVGEGKVEIQEFPKPKVEKDGALLRVTHCGVCGTDPHIFKGDLAVPTPLVLGHEFAGIIEEMGSDFPRKDMRGKPLEIGDAVTLGTSLVCGECHYCRFVPQRNNLCENCDIYGITLTSTEAPHLFGGYAEYVYLKPGSWVYKVPEGMDLEIAALADPMACATRTFERAYGSGIPSANEGFGACKAVVIQGLGTIGILAAAAAKTAGAYPVIGIENVSSRIEMGKKFGCDHIIDMKVYKTSAEREERVKELTNGLGADVVLEMAGVPQAFEESIMLVRPGGKIIEFGHFSDVGCASINAQHIVNKDLDICGVFAYPNSQIGIALDLLNTTKERFPYNELITHRFSVEDAEKALLASKDKSCVKSMIVPEIR